MSDHKQRSRQMVETVFAVTLVLGASILQVEAEDPLLVKDINPFGSSAPFELRSVNGTLFFSANDGISGHELWRSNGTSAGTVLVKDINPGSAGSTPRTITALNSTLLFSAKSGALGFELWKSDGTEAGTVLVKDINPGPADSTPSELTIVNGTVFFQASSNGIGTELWKTDGTAAGTVLVKDVNPGAASSMPIELTDVNGTLFFKADDRLPTFNHRELWKSDGTAAGTVRVKNIHPGPPGSHPLSLTNLGGTLYFSADDGIHGDELWKSDGTEAGTVMIKDINPGLGSGATNFYPTIMNGTLFFRADDGTTGPALWKSDGTAAGTVLVKDLDPSAYSPPIWLTNVDGTVFFAFYDDLWKSDGTTEGTVLLKALDTNYPMSLEYLTDVNGTLFFTANDGIHGQEVWMSDGTEAGTVLAADVNPGDAFSFSWPANLTAVDGMLMFQAENDSHGRELWAVAPTAPGAVPDGRAGPDGQGVTGTPFTIGKGPGGDITLTWDDSSCATGTADYAIYEGVLGSFASHASMLCSTGGATAWQITPDSEDRYYLVVPVIQTMEGSYGHGSDGSEREQGAPACGEQVLQAGCF